MIKKIEKNNNWLLDGDSDESGKRDTLTIKTAKDLLYFP